MENKEKKFKLIRDMKFIPINCTNAVECSKGDVFTYKANDIYMEGYAYFNELKNSQYLGYFEEITENEGIKITDQYPKPEFATIKVQPIKTKLTIEELIKLKESFTADEITKILELGILKD